MNYRAIAVQIGDLLKYDTTINEVGRVASSVFPFAREEFPNEFITSSRAQLIHDWILTLAKQTLADDTRNQLLLQFVQGITPLEKQEQADRILQQHNVAQAGTDREQVEALASRELHPEVIKHARTLFVQGNYFHAVFEVVKAYNKQVAFKAQSALDGADLMLSVWSAKKGVLKVTPCENETDRNVQDGVMFLSAGLMRAVRNPTAHEPATDWPIGRVDCLDLLSFMSFLFRRLDDAVYFPSS